MEYLEVGQVGINTCVTRREMGNRMKNVFHSELERKKSKENEVCKEGYEMEKGFNFNDHAFGRFGFR